MSRLDEIKKCHDLVENFFEGEPEKAKLWFSLPNPNLGGLTPNWMVEHGKVKKLLSFIKSSLASNKGEDQ